MPQAPRPALAKLIARLRDDDDPKGVEIPILAEIWGKLNSKRQAVLRYLAELVHPEPEERVASYLGNVLTFNQFSKAIRALKSLNLIVVKARGGADSDSVELHPLIRDFIRHRFPREERAPYIESLISFCDRMIAQFRAAILNAPFSILENWTAKVELCLRCGRYSEALDAISEVQEPLRMNGFSEELIRLGTEVLRNAPLDTLDEKAMGRHDYLWRGIIVSLSEMDRGAEADTLLAEFEKTITGKTARYVLLCDVYAYSLFLRHRLDEAADWAQRGVDLKTASNLDTRHDSGHTLALAKRDRGDPEGALKYFLKGENLESICNPAEFDARRGGHFYGNIGRCLQLTGRLEEALVCLRKSARALDTGRQGEDTLMNRGWAARWLGEVLEAKGEYSLAYAAFRRAACRWRVVSPARASQAIEAAEMAWRRLATNAGPPADDCDCDRLFEKFVGV